MRERPAWLVSIAAHDVELRGRSYHVAEVERTSFEPSERDAKVLAIREAHMDANVPPFRSLLRQSWAHCSALETVWTPS